MNKLPWRMYPIKVVKLRCPVCFMMAACDTPFIAAEVARPALNE